MIRAIIFDCFGVLTTDLWKEFCATLPKGEVLAQAKELNRQQDMGLISRDEFERQIKKMTGRYYYDSQSSSKVIDKNEPLLDYIKELKRNYKIGLLSNVADDWIIEVLLNRDEQDLFDDMVFSYRIGTVKPDPNTYNVSAANLGVLPAECIMIDDIDRYCLGAEAVGMKSVVYQDLPQLKTDLETILRS